tara:strand:+ start:112 stop:270 length:159 start_codon:yes stop_codon:yes gene_type:complete
MTRPKILASPLLVTDFLGALYEGALTTGALATALVVFPFFFFEPQEHFLFIL